jgi:hypothetical protein
MQEMTPIEVGAMTYGDPDTKKSFEIQPKTTAAFLVVSEKVCSSWASRRFAQRDPSSVSRQAIKTSRFAQKNSKRRNLVLHFADRGCAFRFTHLTRLPKSTPFSSFCALANP